MNETPSFDIDDDMKELLSKNVPKKFNRSVEQIRKRRQEEFDINREEEEFRFAEVARHLHPSPSFQNVKALTERLQSILHVYLAMKSSVDQVVNPKEVFGQLNKLVSKMYTVEIGLRDEVRDKLIAERLSLDDIFELPHTITDFNRAEQIDQKTAIAHLMVQNMHEDIRVLQHYFQYKAGMIGGRGRRKNDYSIHYLVFALADLFKEVDKIDGAIMVSFKDDLDPIGAFWHLVSSFCDNLDSDLKKEYVGEFPQMIKTICLRYKKIDYSTSQLTAHPDTQLLLDFMAAVHRAKSTK